MSERKKQTLIEQVKSVNIKETILNNLWLEILLAITYISNLLPTFLWDRLNVYETSNGLFPQLNHLKVLGSIVYIFIHKEKKISSQLNEKLELNANYWLVVMVILSTKST